ncbi:MAG TPA: hypothetical protein PLB31_06855 [Fimbriimonadaceae bacterium]|nr:hypothetical protein [Armatimonadota bacterium]HCM74187.1 hypothetical protein [Armatimonadota bacterium]HRD30203.1 hypothetical protein [Fimbriimonadaceae bacterium]HRE94490.1 hypothetical protein [Fimbriimonadaceae bacterium]HRI74176.1 hypothetical protein [Fimbriimonadaceae bacterium]
MVTWLAALVLAQEGRDSRDGLSAAQIVGMGYSAWYESYMKTRDENTMTMVEASITYRDALQEVNDEAILRLPVAQGDALFALRTDLESITVNTTTVGSYLSGGGTIWSLITAANAVESEVFIQKTMQRETLPQRPQSDVWAKYRELRDSVSSKSEPEDRQGSKQGAQEALQNLSETIQRTAGRIQNQPRFQRERIFAKIYSLMDSSSM